MGEALHSNLCEEKNLKKVPESFYTFFTTPHEVRKNVELIEKTSEAKVMNQSSSSDDCVHRYNIKIVHLFVPELQLINTKPVIKKQIKDFGDLKKFKALKILLIEYKKIDYHISMRKMFHSSAKLIVNDPDTDKALR